MNAPAPYITEQECADYHAARPTADAWAAVTNKSAAILMASDFVDANYTFSGAKTLDTQDREFPRNGASQLPYQFKCAVCELALVGMTVTEAKALDKKSIKVGSIAIDYSIDSTVKQKSYVDLLLKGMTITKAAGDGFAVAKLVRS